MFPKMLGFLLKERKMNDEDEFFDIVGTANATTVTQGLIAYCVGGPDEESCDKQTPTPIEDGWLGVPSELDGTLWFCRDCGKEVEKLARELDGE
jgi:hypothetical protein